MSEEIINEEVSVNETQKYIDTINDLKKNSVSRKEYDKLRDENKTLLEAIVNGQVGNGNTSTEDLPPKPSIQELREKAYGKNCDKLTDVEYIETVCDLRDALLESEGIDYMAPTGSQYNPDFNDVQTANKVYNGFRHCLDIANGDNNIFIQEMTRITGDTGIMNKFRNRRI